MSPVTGQSKTASVITSIALSTRSHRERIPEMSEPLIATPSVDCSKVSCQ